MTPNYLRRMGWTRETFKLGDRLRAEGSLAKDGSNRLSLDVITLPDGTKMSPSPSAEQREAFYKRNP